MKSKIQKVFNQIESANTKDDSAINYGTIYDFVELLVKKTKESEVTWSLDKQEYCYFEFSAKFDKLFIKTYLYYHEANTHIGQHRIKIEIIQDDKCIKTYEECSWQVDLLHKIEFDCWEHQKAQVEERKRIIDSGFMYGKLKRGVQWVQLRKGCIKGPYYLNQYAPGLNSSANATLIFVGYTGQKYKYTEKGWADANGSKLFYTPKNFCAYLTPISEEEFFAGRNEF